MSCSGTYSLIVFIKVEPDLLAGQLCVRPFLASPNPQLHFYSGSKKKKKVDTPPFKMAAFCDVKKETERPR